MFEKSSSDARPDAERELPAAKSRLRRAIWALTDPQPPAPSLYNQLRTAVRGQQSNTGTGGGSKSRPPMWTDAFDLHHQITDTITAWTLCITFVHPTFIGPLHHSRTRTQHRRTTQPETLQRLTILETKPWRPQDTHSVDQIATIIEAWAKAITQLLDPPHVKHITAPCPACGAHTTQRRDAAGELVRLPALQLITATGCTCLVCKAHWAPEYYTHLCRVLGFDKPAGVLE